MIRSRSLLTYAVASLFLLFAFVCLLCGPGCTSISYVTPEGAEIQYVSILQAKEIEVKSPTGTSVSWSTNSDPAVRLIDAGAKIGAAAAAGAVAAPTP